MELSLLNYIVYLIESDGQLDDREVMFCSIFPDLTGLFADERKLGGEDFWESDEAQK